MIQSLPEIWNEIIMIGEGISQAISTARNSIYQNKSHEEETEKSLAREMNDILVCLKLDNAFAKFIISIFNELSTFNYEAFDFSQIDTLAFSNQIYSFIQDLYKILVNCITSSHYIGPFLSEKVNSLNFKNLNSILISLQSNSFIISYEIKQLAINYRKSLFHQLGESLVHLFLWAFPLPPFEDNNNEMHNNNSVSLDINQNYSPFQISIPLEVNKVPVHNVHVNITAHNDQLGPVGALIKNSLTINSPSPSISYKYEIPTSIMIDNESIRIYYINYNYHQFDKEKNLIGVISGKFNLPTEINTIF